MKCAYCQRAAVLSVNDQDKPDEPMAYCLFCFWTWSRVNTEHARIDGPIYQLAFFAKIKPAEAHKHLGRSRSESRRES